MTLKTSIAVAGLVLGLAAATDAAAAEAACRTVRSGAVEKVCRWQVGKGEFVDVYYGTPSPAAPPEPARYEADTGPAPVYYAEPAYYDYGYAYAPFLYGTGRVRRMRDRHRGARPLTFGPSPGLRVGASAAFENERSRGRGGWGN